MFNRTRIAAAALLCVGVLAAVSSVSAQADTAYKVRLNSVGFIADLPKKASVKITGGGGAQPAVPIPGEFTVKRVSGDETVFTGTLGSNVNNTDTRDTIRVADFSAFKTPGRYYVAAAGSRSPEFEIADTALNDAYRAMMLGMYLWRCGTAVDATYNGKRYQHAACHLNDGNLQYVGGSGTKPATRGWHDAGDYNKYIVNSGVTVGLMLKAWEHHGDALKNIKLTAVQDEGNIPAYLSEVKWNLDWVSSMQLDDGKVSHKMSTRNFCGFIMPEEETAVRYFVPWGTAATASFVAMLAQASRVYAPYDAQLAAKWLAQAKTGYDVLAASSFVSADQSAFSTGTYSNRDDADQRLWAAAEMWETTGEEKYLKDFEKRSVNVAAHLGWGDVNVLAALTYLSSEKPGRRQSRVDSLQANLITQANNIANNTATHGYGRAFGSASSSYYWGAHGALTANTYLLNVAYKFTGDKKYREAGHEIVGHILGRNYFGRSFVTGVGYYPPADPHDRRSIASKTPWPGYLIGGPHSGNLKESNGAPIAPLGATCASAAVCYFDYYEDYARNEIAINWNASMLYALSGYVSTPGSPSGILPERNVKPSAASASKVKTTRLVQIKNGKSASIIPSGAKIYGLNGKLVAQRKAGDANAPVIRRNGVFIMRVDATY